MKLAMTEHLATQTVSVSRNEELIGIELRGIGHILLLPEIAEGFANDILAAVRERPPNWPAKTGETKQ